MDKKSKYTLVTTTLTLCLLFLAHCLSPVSARAESIHPPASRSAISPASFPTPTSTPAPSATSQPTRQDKGRIERHELRHPLLKLPMEILVYLPPGYDQHKQQRYPVLYLIHGQNFTEDQWDRLGADETADRLIAAGDIPPFLIVMPHDRLWTSPEQSPFGTVFLENLIPWVDETFRTKNQRAFRAIGGLSRGGAWAVHLGISAWELFASIGVHSGFYFRGEEYQTRQWLQAIPPDDMPRMFVDIGDSDHLRPANDDLEEMLLKHNIPHEWYLFPGRHEEAYWSSHLEKYLRWYTAQW